VSELIEAAAASRCSRNWPARKNAGRIVLGDDIIAAQPDIYHRLLVRQEIRAVKVAARPGFDRFPRRHRLAAGGQSTLILQPGPARSPHGLDALAGIITEWVRENLPGRAKKPDRDIKDLTSMQPNKARADRVDGPGTWWLADRFRRSTRLLPHVPGVWPFAASGCSPAGCCACPRWPSSYRWPPRCF